MAGSVSRPMKVFVTATVLLSTAGYTATEFLNDSTRTAAPSDDPASACGALPTPSQKPWDTSSVLDARSAELEPGHAVAVRCAEDDGRLFSD
jgi:hypothetical protein